MSDILKFENVGYWYEKDSHIIKNINITFQKGKFYSIIGPSGSGKTTFLSLAAGLDSAKEGKLLLNDKDVKEIGLGNYRKNHISIIFQNFNLLPYMTAMENVISAMTIKGIKDSNIKETAMKMFERVGLDEKQANQNVLTLSGGQQQRVAIARALLSNTDIIIADEPTGNLDEENSKSIIQLFKDISKRENKAVIMVTHNNEIANECDEIFRLKNKELVNIGLSKKAI